MAKITTLAITVLRTFDETSGLPLRSYTSLDLNGKEIQINTKNPSVHKSSNPLEQWAPVFLNIGWILQNYDEVKDSTSNDPKAITNRKKGDVKIFIKNNFIETLDIPGQIGIQDQTQVVVLYGEKTNYTLTYSIFTR